MSFKPRFGVLLLMFIATIGICCSNKNKPSVQENAGIEERDVLARVADLVINVEDLKKESNRRRIRGMPFIGKEDLLHGMVDRLAILHQAKSSSLMDDVEVKKEINNLLVSKFIALEQEEKLRDVKVTDEELKQEYEKRIDEFTKRSMSRISLLKLSAGKNSSDTKLNEVRDKIHEARKLAGNLNIDGRGPASQGFGALAVKFSEDQASRYKGGDIGWRIKGEKDPVFPGEVIEAAHNLELGELTDVMELNGDFYVVMKTDFRPTILKKFGDVKKVLKVDLIQQKREEIQNSFRGQARIFAGVHINFENLNRLDDFSSAKKNIATKPSPLPQD